VQRSVDSIILATKPPSMPRPKQLIFATINGRNSNKAAIGRYEVTAPRGMLERSDPCKSRTVVRIVYRIRVNSSSLASALSV
jgi:hypothetical protein